MKKLSFVILFVVMTFAINGCYYDVVEELYPSSGNTCDTTNVTYTVTIKPIIDAQCNNCHSTSAAQGGIILDSYTSLKDCALNGRLLGAIRQEQGFSPMPKGGTKLSSCEITKIELWVAHQYPEN